MTGTNNPYGFTGKRCLSFQTKPGQATPYVLAYRSSITSGSIFSKDSMRFTIIRIYMVKTDRSTCNKFYSAAFQQFFRTFVNTTNDQNVSLLDLVRSELVRRKILYISKRFHNSFQIRNRTICNYFYFILFGLQR